MSEEHRKIITEIKDLVREAEENRTRWYKAGDVGLYNYFNVRLSALEEVIQVIYDLTYGED